MSVVSLLALALFIFLAIKYTKSNKKVGWLRVTLGLLIGGDLGNIIDRTFYSDHMVTDFLSFTLYYPWVRDGKVVIESFDYAVFNIADSAIVVGVIILLIYMLFINKNFLFGSEEKTKDEVVKVDLDE